MNPGDILRVKISGETVQVLKAPNEVGLVEVLRALATRNGIEYQREHVDAHVLEPVEANIDREFREAVYRTNLFRSGLVVQQQELQGSAQSADDQGELFDEDDSEEPLN